MIHVDIIVIKYGRFRFRETPAVTNSGRIRRKLFLYSSKEWEKATISW